jgi:hypothetical protein
MNTTTRTHTPRRSPRKQLTIAHAALFTLLLPALVVCLHARLARLSNGRDERGEIEQVTILKGLFAAAALAIGAIIVAKFTGAANAIPTGP